MRKLHIILIMLAMLLAAQQIKSQQLSQDPLYKLVFFDEFDALSLDTSKWYPHYPWSPSFYNNNILKPACTTAFPADSTVPMAFHYGYGVNIDNNRIYDTTGTGFHRLRSKKESPPVTGHIWDYSANPDTTISKTFKFTSSMLWSRYNFKYAYIEMKYKLSNVTAPNVYNSYGPNFWLWSSDANANWSEIDIFEEKGSDWSMTPNTLYRKTHPANYAGIPQDTVLVKSSGAVCVGPYNGGNWHTVGCEWTPDYADFYYDSNDTIRRYKDANVHVSQMSPMTVIADVYAPSWQFCLPFDSVNTQMPFDYDIDYIRVYQVKQNCISKTYLNTSSSAYADTLYQDLTIGGQAEAQCLIAEYII